jgi:hypothetical protein
MPVSIDENAIVPIYLGSVNRAVLLEYAITIALHAMELIITIQILLVTFWSSDIVTNNKWHTSA